MSQECAGSIKTAFQKLRDKESGVELKNNKVLTRVTAKANVVTTKTEVVGKKEVGENIPEIGEKEKRSGEVRSKRKRGKEMDEDVKEEESVSKRSKSK